MTQLRDALPGQWARLNADLSCGLRRGAWYRVVRLTPDEAVLQVPRREQVRVPRRHVETLSNRPRHWTVVPRSRDRDAEPAPTGWHARYAVCPACRTRAPITSYALDMRCPSCDGLFSIAWEEKYLTAR
jgi:hypothetical protein